MVFVPVPFCLRMRAGVAPEPLSSTVRIRQRRALHMTHKGSLAIPV